MSEANDDQSNDQQQLRDADEQIFIDIYGRSVDEIIDQAASSDTASEMCLSHVNYRVVDYSVQKVSGLPPTKRFRGLCFRPLQLQDGEEDRITNGIADFLQLNRDTLEELIFSFPASHVTINWSSIFLAIEMMPKLRKKLSLHRFLFNGVSDPDRQAIQSIKNLLQPPASLSMNQLPQGGLTLQIVDCQFGSTHLPVLIEAIRETRILCKLRISRCTFEDGSGDLNEVLVAVAESRSQLTAFSWKKKKKNTPSLLPHAVSSIVSILQNHKTITELKLAGFNLMNGKNTTFTRFLLALMDHKCLQHLCLLRCGLSNSAVKALFQTVLDKEKRCRCRCDRPLSHKCLQRLYLRGNPLNLEGRDWIDGLPKLYHLQHISLDRAILHSDKFILNAVQQNLSLQMTLDDFGLFRNAHYKAQEEKIIRCMARNKLYNYAIKYQSRQNGGGELEPPASGCWPMALEKLGGNDGEATPVYSFIRGVMACVEVPFWLLTGTLVNRRRPHQP